MDRARRSDSNRGKEKQRDRDRRMGTEKGTEEKGQRDRNGDRVTQTGTE